MKLNTVKLLVTMYNDATNGQIDRKEKKKYIYISIEQRDLLESQKCVLSK